MNSVLHTDSVGSPHVTLLWSLEGKRPPQFDSQVLCMLTSRNNGWLWSQVFPGQPFLCCPPLLVLSGGLPHLGSLSWLSWWVHYDYVLPICSSPTHICWGRVASKHLLLSLKPPLNSTLLIHMCFYHHYYSFIVTAFLGILLNTHLQINCYSCPQGVFTTIPITLKTL